jgi:hypothetical protein
MQLASTRALVAIGLIFAGFAGVELSPPAASQSGPGWTQLFDGKTLDGWTQTGEANWRVEDGAIVADKGKGGHLVTKASYKNLMIYSEFWSDEEANSGIFVRCKDPKAIGARSCYEVNIFDKRPDPSYGTGAIVYFAEVNPMPKAAGKWNTYEIRAQGPHMTVTLNGVKTADANDSKHPRGPFALQYGAGVVKFRNVQVRPL